MRRLLLPCLCLLLPGLACNEGGGDSSDTATEATSGDGDGDPTGDGDGDPTGDGDGDPTGDGDGDPTGDGDGDPTGDGDPAGECETAEQCVVVNDCCNCSAATIDMVPPCENAECLVSQCDGEFGGPYVPEAACRVGTCALATVSCNLADVLCDAAEPPPCEGGRIRSVIDDCYGPCVLPSMCEALPSGCVDCGEGFACVETQSGAPSHCIPLPPGCGGTASCDCVSPWLGEICNGGCSDNGGTLLCEDGG